MSDGVPATRRGSKGCARGVTFEDHFESEGGDRLGAT